MWSHAAQWPDRPAVCGLRHVLEFRDNQDRRTAADHGKRLKFPKQPLYRFPGMPVMSGIRIRKRSWQRSAACDPSFDRYGAGFSDAVALRLPHALPAASEKRPGTKSRWEGHQGCVWLYGDWRLAAVPAKGHGADARNIAWPWTLPGCGLAQLRRAVFDGPASLGESVGRRRSPPAMSQRGPAGARYESAVMTCRS